MLAISEIGCTPPKKKYHLESGLNQRDEGAHGFSVIQVPVVPRSKTSTGGVPNWQAPVSTRKLADHHGARGGGCTRRERDRKRPSDRATTSSGAVGESGVRANTGRVGLSSPHGIVKVMMMMNCSADRAEYPRVLEFAYSRAPPRAPT